MSIEPISRIDPEKGRLYFRGIEAAELARTRSFEDVAFLLIYGKLPDEKQSTDFLMLMRKHRRLIETELPQIIKLIDTKSNERPEHAIDNIDRTQMMGLRPLAKRVDDFAKKNGLSPFDSLLAFVALSPAVLAAGWRHLKGKPIVPSKDLLNHSHNFLWMLKETKLSSKDQKDLEACFILHMDDPSNPSLSALEKSISDGESLSDSLVAALDHHVDPLHHGAGEASMKLMIEMGDSSNVEEYLSRVIESGNRIYGLGHRIYKTIDPRAVVLREILKGRTDNQAASALYDRIGQTARIGAKLIHQRKKRIAYPNVDLYNAAVYHTFGIPYYLNTELFAVSRAAGWAAHIAEWLELA